MKPALFSAWQSWALLSACFAALTAIFAKVGVENINPDLATFIRTIVVLLAFSMLLFFSGMGGLLLTISVFLQVGQGFSAIHTGVTFIPMSLGMALGAGASGGFLGKRFGRRVIQAGTLVSLTGYRNSRIFVFNDYDYTPIN